jgi:anaerobic magnesium-protoporphyrin IX monomethyl ester cyclase
VKVLLIVPGCLNPKQTYREYPLGVGLIATTLRQQGHEAAVYDQNVEGPDDEALFNALDASRSEVVGFSVITPAYPAAQRQIRRLKSLHSDVVVAAGGIHASLFPADLLADGADVVVPGEGVRTMRLLVDRLAQGRPWQDLPGLAYRDAAGNLVRTQPQPGQSADEAMGIIDRDVYNLPRYTHHSMLASLGCPFGCTFCSNYTGKMLADGVIVRSLDRILEEMHYLAGTHQAKQIFFVDDVFLLTADSILTFCLRLQRDGPQVQWIAQLRADTLTPAVAQAMAAAGCRRISLGVESGCDAILRRTGKGISCATIRRAVEHAKDAGLRVKTGWIFGLPGSLDEQYESISFMRQLRPHEISVHQLIPFPGTDYYQRPATHGLRIRDPKDFASFCYGGLGDNVSFDYLSQDQLIQLLEDTATALESEGYVNSDRATAQDEYVFSTPLNTVSMRVFR